MEQINNPKTETVGGISKKLYREIHYWLKKNYGKADRCENRTCKGLSDTFQWAKKKKKVYDFKRNNFDRLCAKCHKKRDMTEEFKRRVSKANKGKKRKGEALENLREWGKRRIGVPRDDSDKEKISKGCFKPENRVRYGRKLVHLMPLCEEKGIKYKTVKERLRKGWSVKDALEVKIGRWSEYMRKKINK